MHNAYITMCTKGCNCSAQILLSINILISIFSWIFRSFRHDIPIIYISVCLSGAVYVATGDYSDAFFFSGAILLSAAAILPGLAYAKKWENRRSTNSVKASCSTTGKQHQLQH